MDFLFTRKKWKLGLLVLLGAMLLGACTPFIIGPNDPSASLVIGRIVVDNKFSGGLSGILPTGVLDKALEVEVQTRDAKQYFKVITEEQGYFLIPNLAPNTYQLLGVIIEGTRGGGDRERYAPRLRRPTFTPVPGKLTYIGTVYLDISDKGESKIREVREDDRAKNYFIQRYGSSPWGAREFTSVGFGAITTTATAQTQKPAVDIAPMAFDQAKANKPEWKLGTNWRYAWKQPGTSGTLTREFIREDIFEGIPIYVMRVGKNEYSYTKDSLGLFTDRQGGKVTLKRTPAFEHFSWPIYVGKEWRSTYLAENITEKSSQNFDYRLVVSGMEKVQVPAGHFDTYKIETYNFYSGNLAVEYWYSPETKWFVKLRIYRQDGVREEELISIKTD
jgi:hypothetical protein